ncbi:hypothetical protein ACHHYP_05728 [Achlya hypogyna]|uniref:DUF6818 domain-containing protein n=1 Tax=Achlya hypogyna TaxID=1202772 RepID=A0A1V9YXC1_ACHHY|nr:hypothetical protein ACHHYP_05728 [Achlya hypogyna]
MLKRTGHGRGKGWKANEESDLLACVSDILPIDTNEWEDVVIAYNFHRQRTDRRDLSSVRRKYKSLRNMSSATGSMSTRQHSTEAKRIQEEINRKKTAMNSAEGSTLAPEPPADSMPRAEPDGSPPIANVYATHGLRPKEIAAFSKRVPKRGAVPPSRRQILIAMRNNSEAASLPDEHDLVPLRPDDSPAYAAIPGGESDGAMALARQSLLQGQTPTSSPPAPMYSQAQSQRRAIPLAKKPRLEFEDQVISRLLAMEESRERWMREMEERREARDRERDERLEALRLEREERDRQREEYRDKMDALREERTARHDELMAMVLTKFLSASSPHKEGPAI